MNEGIWRSFPLELLGYDRQAVERARMQLIAEQAGELNQLRLALERERAAGEMLRGQLAWLRLQRPELLLSQLDASRQQLEASVGFTQELLRWHEAGAQAEARRLERLAQRQMADLDNRIFDLCRQLIQQAAALTDLIHTNPDRAWAQSPPIHPAPELPREPDPAPSPPLTVTADKPAPEPAAGAAEVAEPPGTSDITRFMAGKVVGQDLHSRTGQLLAQKGEVITTGLVDQAESAGVLTELILNMAWPETDA